MLAAPWMSGLEKAMGALAARTHGRPFAALVVVLLLSVPSFYLARSIGLDADLVGLLPRSFRSVQDLDLLRERFGGMGYVVVAAQRAPPATLKRFADDMAPKLAALSEIRFVEHKRAYGFFEDRALLYLEPQDLTEIRARIDERLAYERRAHNPLFIDLEEEGPPSLDFSDLERKYAGAAAKRVAGGGEPYYIDPAARLLVLLCKPKSASTDLAYARKVTDEVRELIAAQDLSAYPGLEVAITGAYEKKVDQQREIAVDLARASAIALVLVLLYLVFHFRSVLAVVFTLTPVLIAITWTYAVVALGYGRLNLITGFLGAILGGLGVEHGIHLLSRYIVLRHEGKRSKLATREAFAHTGGSAFISALVAALTFLSLAISEFRAFREFGVIASIGMMLGIGAYIIMLPPLLGVAARLGWQPSKRDFFMAPRSELAHLLPRFARPITFGAVAVMVLLACIGPRVGFDYDFRSLEDADLPSIRLDRKVDGLVGFSQTPVVVLTEDLEQERDVIAELNARRAALGAESAIDFVAGLDDLVPREQDEKLVIIAAIRESLARVDPARLGDVARADYERALRLSSVRAFGRRELPESVRLQFEDRTSQDRGLVLVFPKVSLSHSDGVRRFAKEVRDIELGSGGKLSAAGESMILADILDMVTRESPLVLAAAVLSVLLAMWLALGNLRSAVICLTPTLASVTALVGVMALGGVEFNYLNIMVIAVLIGTTVDAGVHFLSRWRERGDTHFAEVYGETGRAIVGGLLTSAVGFGSLTLARHPGLSSIGELATLGFATNVVVVLLAFPAFLLHVEQRRAKRSLAAAFGKPED